MLILLNKPFNVLCQFTDQDDRETLADYIDIKGVYPAGRLDRDSEGLVLLTDDGTLQHLISHPRHKLTKTYWVQVEGKPDNHALGLLKSGVELKDGIAAAVNVSRMDEPKIWPRNPPIRYRRHIPTSWLEITLTEGRNRQVRRMTAATGHPTLRLIRVQVGPWSLGDLEPGEWQEAKIPDEWRKMIRHEMETSRHRRRNSRGSRPVPHGRGNRG